MAMPTKGSRLIVVDDETYRWKFSRAKGADISNCEIIVELAENPQSILITSPAGIDQWFGEEYIYQVTPSLIESGIRQAIASGWNPNSSGTFLFFKQGPFSSPAPRRVFSMKNFKSEM